MIYVVKTGDSLWKISEKVGMPIDTIQKVNGLENVDQLVPGLALYIPHDTLNDRTYIIQAGDQLWALAQRYRSSVDQILEANPGLSPSQLTIGQKVTIPSPQPLTIKTLGFIVPYSIEEFLPMLREIAPHLTYLAVVAYTFTERGYAYKQVDDRQFVEETQKLGLQPLLCVRNFLEGDFSAELVGGVFADETYRSNLVDSLVRFVDEEGYAGVSIDFEFVPPPQRGDFETFLQSLKDALGERILHVNVHAKTADAPENPIIGAYDYEVIGEIADIVAVMTIDYGYPTGPPKPVAPIWWMEEVVAFALQKIPAEKMQVSFPLYGYDKAIPSFETKALSALEAQNQAIKRYLPIQYQQEAQSPYYRYVDQNTQREVWFEDIRSFQAKYALLDANNLLGTTFWQVRFRFPQNWAYMEQHIKVLRK